MSPTGKRCSNFRFLVDLDAASSGWDRLFKYHGRPSGVFGADEFLAGLEAARGYVLFLLYSWFCGRLKPGLVQNCVKSW